MKMWGPQLRQLIRVIIQGAMVYPNCVTRYTNSPIIPVDYEISVEQNTPLPEDEIEERNMDLSEVESKTMSRKAYMKKWRGLTDEEVNDELEQIALERQMIEDSSFGSTGNTVPYPESDTDIDDNIEDTGKDSGMEEETTEDNNPDMVEE